MQIGRDDTSGIYQNQFIAVDQCRFAVGSDQPLARRYINESFMTQPVESVQKVNAMKTKLTIKVKVDLALTISALTGLIVAIAKFF